MLWLATHKILRTPTQQAYGLSMVIITKSPSGRLYIIIAHHKRNEYFTISLGLITEKVHPLGISLLPTIANTVWLQPWLREVSLCCYGIHTPAVPTLVPNIEICLLISTHEGSSDFILGVICVSLTYRSTNWVVLSLDYLSNLPNKEQNGWSMACGCWVGIYLIHHIKW